MIKGSIESLMRYTKKKEKEVLFKIIKGKNYKNDKMD